MYTAQLAILDHITNGKTRYYPTVKTIEGYAGELRDAIKLAQLHPAIFIWMREGMPQAVVSRYEVDLIVVTSSSSFDKNNHTNNLELSQSIAEYFGKNFSFIYASLPWTIDTEDMSLTTLMINNKFAIVKISFSIRNLK